MMSRATWPHGSVLRFGLVLGALALAVMHSPPAARAQSCTGCVVAAGVDLDLLAEPRLEAEVLRVIPRGTLLRREAGPEINRLAPVTHGDVSGWVIADGFFPVPDTIAGYATTASTAPPAMSTTTGTKARVTLAPLMLRRAPTMEAEPMLVIPYGGVVTLTGEGAENGFVTVDYGGVRGWAYADLLGETVGTGPSGTPNVTTVSKDDVAAGALEPAPVFGAPVAKEQVAVAPIAAAPVAAGPVLPDEPVSAAPVPMAGACDPSYPEVCLPASPTLDCADVGFMLSVIYDPSIGAYDPHGFDADFDGLGCEWG